MVRSSARGVPLFMRHHEAGAHGVTFDRRRIFPPAFANAHATQRGMCKAAVVLWILKMSRRVPGMVIGPEAQILVDAVRIDDLARIHFPVRVPYGFEFAKSLDEFLPEHLVKKFRFGLAVTMFATEAAAVFHTEIGRFFHERAPFLDPRSASQVEAHAAMHATLAKVSVERGVVLVFVVECAQLAKISAELFRRHSRVLPAFPCVGFAGNKSGDAQPGLAHLPNM